MENQQDSAVAQKGRPTSHWQLSPILPSVCCLQVYKLFTRVILNRIDRTIDEGQPCEQSGFRKGFSTMDHIHTITKLIEVSREYERPLCLTFIDLRKAFDSVETEAVMEALDSQGVPTVYKDPSRVIQQLHNQNLTILQGHHH